MPTLTNIHDIYTFLDIEIKQILNTRCRKLQCAHVNLRGMGSKKGVVRFRTMESYLIQNRIPICSVVETWMKDSDIPEISPFYMWFSRPRLTGTGGGVGVLVHRQLGAVDITDEFSTSLEICAISFTLRSRSICFVSCYLPNHVGNTEVEQFGNFLSQIGPMKFDFVIVGGDFNAWSPLWGVYDNIRGRELADVISKHHFVPTRMSSPTRYSSSSQKDTVLDFFVCSPSCTVSNIHVGPQFSDHCIISLNLNFMGGCTNPLRRIYDFRRSWATKSKDLNSYFDSISARDLFLGKTLDELPTIMNDFVLEGWNRFGVSKFVNSDSRPWFTPVAKRHLRRRRYWERQRKRCRRGGGSVSIDGTVYSLTDCETNRRAELVEFFREVSTVRENSDAYISRLVDSDVHSAIKKLYHVRRRDVPTLKKKNPDGSFEVLASCDRGKAEIFSDKFFGNTELPADFPINADSDAFAFSEVGGLVHPYSFDPSGLLVCTSKIGDTIISEDKFKLVSSFIFPQPSPPVTLDCPSEHGAKTIPEETVGSNSLSADVDVQAMPDRSHGGCIDSCCARINLSCPSERGNSKIVEEAVGSDFTVTDVDVQPSVDYSVGEGLISCGDRNTPTLDCPSEHGAEQIYEETNVSNLFSTDADVQSKVVCTPGGDIPLDSPVDYNNDFFSLVEITTTRMGLKKGVGSRGINNDHIRKLKSNNFDQILAFVFNSYFYFTYWPSDWRIASIVPVPKGGGRGWDPGDYRPISIVDTLGKFFERMVYLRLKKVCGSEISDFQSGGLARNGSVQQLIRVSELVELAVSSTDWDERGREFFDQSVAIALLDCSKAFDRMFRPLLLLKLHRLGVRGRLFQSVVAYFHDRRQFVKLGNCQSDSVVTRNGGPQGSVIVLFSWLVYINDLPDSIRKSLKALFVDDIFLAARSRGGGDLIRKLNEDLLRVHEWSVINHMVFSYEKFHMIDVSRKGNRLPLKLREHVSFGKGSPPWSRSARYLGAILDDKFSFLPMIDDVTARFDSCWWRIRNHCDLVSGSSPRTIEIIFLTWMLPVVEYGSALWIFRIKRCLHYSFPVLGTYKQAFDKLNSLYFKYARNILGVDKSTSRKAILVRLGWMPLDYYLAFRAAIWYFKICRGLAGDLLRTQHGDWFADDEQWARTSFCKNALDFINRFEICIDDIKSVTEFKTLLKSCIFAELDKDWKSYPEAEICHTIHPTWKPIKWTRNILTKNTTSVYHQLAVGRGQIGCRHKYLKKLNSPYCRFGCNCDETLTHIMFDCPHLKDERDALMKFCRETNVPFTISEIFTNPLLQRRVERYLSYIFTTGNCIGTFDFF